MPVGPAPAIKIGKVAIDPVESFAVSFIDKTFNVARLSPLKIVHQSTPSRNF
jgi:hypothetical protein